MTFKQIKATVGVCVSCGEWTSVLEPCCGRGAIVEGRLLTDLNVTRLVQEAADAGDLEALVWLKECVG